MKIKLYKCTHSIFEYTPNNPFFNSGKIYKSEEEGCLTDDMGDKEHRAHPDILFTHFKPYKQNKRKGRDNKERR